MKIFTCAHCGQLVYFENTYCEKCRHPLGFVTETMVLATLSPLPNNQFEIYNQPGKSYRYCANKNFSVCNWIIPANYPSSFCIACNLNNTIPDLTRPANKKHWRLIEHAKHRLVYTLLKLSLPVFGKEVDPVHGIAFDFLGKRHQQDKVLTGHDEGLITINIEEADDVVREQARKNMGEPYRTLLGHFRHEIGHYYWDRLVANTNWLYQYRDIFGNEQADYKNALEGHYRFGAAANWLQKHITPYASSHPWEDWAETWAHYLHMMDTLETAWTFGLNVTPQVPYVSIATSATMDTDPFTLQNFTDIITRWLPFTAAMNSINRSMGHKDLYPFVMSAQVINKQAFIHQLIWSQKTSGG